MLILLSSFDLIVSTGVVLFAGAFVILDVVLGMLSLGEDAGFFRLRTTMKNSVHKTNPLRANPPMTKKGTNDPEIDVV